MTKKEIEFEEIIETTLNQIKETLIQKGREYRRNNNPYHNFEEGAKRSKLTREQVLDGMLLKHEISIADMTNDLCNNKTPKRETIDEKFNDNIIYLLLKKAMFIDRLDCKDNLELKNVALRFDALVDD